MPADYQNRTQSGKGCSGLEFNLYAFVSVKLLCRKPIEVYYIAILSNWNPIGCL